MSCERAKELMIDALVEPLDNERLEELRQHVAGCETCAAEATEYRDLWHRLDTVAIPQPAPGSLKRLQTAVQREFGDKASSTGGGTRRAFAVPGSLVARVAAAIALVGFGAILATGLNDYLRDDSLGDSPIDGRARYLLIMTETQEGPELAAQVQNEFDDWISGLIEQGIMESGIGLVDGPPVGTPPNGTLLNGPVAGFIVIRAADGQEARRIAVASPIIDYGGLIEIRAISGGDSDP